VLSGKKVKESLKSSVPEGIKQTARELQFQLNKRQPTVVQQQQQQPATAATARRKRPPAKKRRGTPKHRKKDIFSH